MYLQVILALYVSVTSWVTQIDQLLTCNNPTKFNLLLTRTLLVDILCFLSIVDSYCTPL